MVLPEVIRRINAMHVDPRPHCALAGSRASKAANAALEAFKASSALDHEVVKMTAPTAFKTLLDAQLVSVANRFTAIIQQYDQSAAVCAAEAISEVSQALESHTHHLQAENARFNAVARTWVDHKRKFVSNEQVQLGCSGTDVIIISWKKCRCEIRTTFDSLARTCTELVNGKTECAPEFKVVDRFQEVTGSCNSNDVKVMGISV